MVSYFDDSEDEESENEYVLRPNSQKHQISSVRQVFSRRPLNDTAEGWGRVQMENYSQHPNDKTFLAPTKTDDEDPLPL